MGDQSIETTKIVSRKTVPTKTVPTNFNKKEIACKTKKFFILLTILLITVALLIAVSIYFYLIKYQTKQQHLLSYHVTKTKLKNVLF